MLLLLALLDAAGADGAMPSLSRRMCHQKTNQKTKRLGYHMHLFQILYASKPKCSPRSTLTSGCHRLAVSEPMSLHLQTCPTPCSVLQHFPPDNISVCRSSCSLLHCRDMLYLVVRSPGSVRHRGLGALRRIPVLGSALAEGDLGSEDFHKHLLRVGTRCRTNLNPGAHTD